MAIFLEKGEERIGPYEIGDVRGMLEKGEIKEDDIAFIGGMNDVDFLVRDIPGLKGRPKSRFDSEYIDPNWNAAEAQMGIYDVDFAGGFSRVSAAFFDWMPWLCSSVGLYLFGSQHFPAWLQLSLWVALPILALAYFSIFESGAFRGQTIGKMIVGIQVTNKGAELISFGRALLRSFSKLFLFWGAIGIIFSDRGRALHDLVAKTVVIRKVD